jgi:ribulose 1,5-bisphosphate carboxylase large subunit-like protein
MGAAAGARAIRQAMDAVSRGEPLVEAGKKHSELAAALERWPETSERSEPGPDQGGGSTTRA